MAATGNAQHVHKHYFPPLCILTDCWCMRLQTGAVVVAAIFGVLAAFSFAWFLSGFFDGGSQMAKVNFLYQSDLEMNKSMFRIYSRFSKSVIKLCKSQLKNVKPVKKSRPQDMSELEVRMIKHVKQIRNFERQSSGRLGDPTKGRYRKVIPWSFSFAKIPPTFFEMFSDEDILRMAANRLPWDKPEGLQHVVDFWNAFMAWKKRRGNDKARKTAPSQAEEGVRAAARGRSKGKGRGRRSARPRTHVEVPAASPTDAAAVADLPPTTEAPTSRQELAEQEIATAAAAAAESRTARQRPPGLRPSAKELSGPERPRRAKRQDDPQPLPDDVEDDDGPRVDPRDPCGEDALWPRVRLDREMYLERLSLLVAWGDLWDGVDTTLDVLGMLISSVMMILSCLCACGVTRHKPSWILTWLIWVGFFTCYTVFYFNSRMGTISSSRDQWTDQIGPYMIVFSSIAIVFCILGIFVAASYYYMIYNAGYYLYHNSTRMQIVVSGSTKETPKVEE